MPGLRPAEPAVVISADAATLILVRREKGREKVLLGQRHADHKFMPGKFVFPGGRSSAEDGRVTGCLGHGTGDLAPADAAGSWQVQPHSGRAAWRSPRFARPSRRQVSSSASRFMFLGQPWADGPRFSPPAMRPALAGLRYFARAITPPGGIRRFDTRFFVADARCVANLDRPLPTGTDELLSPAWFTFAEARRLDLASITLRHP